MITYWRIETRLRGDHYPRLAIFYDRSEAKERWRTISEVDDLVAGRVVECKPGEEPRVVARWTP